MGLFLEEEMTWKFWMQLGVVIAAIMFVTFFIAVGIELFTEYCMKGYV